MGFIFSLLVLVLSAIDYFECIDAYDSALILAVRKTAVRKK